TEEATLKNQQIFTQDAEAPMLEWITAAVLLAVAAALYVKYTETNKRLKALQTQYNTLQTEYAALQRRVEELQREAGIKAAEEARRLFDEWRRQEEERLRAELEKAIEERYKTELERRRLEKEAEIREDAIRRSISTLLGRIGEQLAPLLMTQTLGVDPRDLRFLGTPIDFKGLSQDNPQEILFRSGKTTKLTEKRQAVKRLYQTSTNKPKRSIHPLYTQRQLTTRNY
ncbi:MAG: Holliday junction resolvase-like protein, partial [Pyrobaculum sp.]